MVSQPPTVQGIDFADTEAYTIESSARSADENPVDRRSSRRVAEIVVSSSSRRASRTCKQHIVGKPQILFSSEVLIIFFLAFDEVFNCKAQNYIICVAKGV